MTPTIAIFAYLLLVAVVGTNLYVYKEISSWGDNKTGWLRLLVSLLVMPAVIGAGLVGLHFLDRWLLPCG